MQEWSIWLTSVALLILLVGMQATKQDICELITTFDAACKFNDEVIILSAHPCKSSTSLSLTIIDLKNGTQYKYIELVGDSKGIISLWNDDQKGVKLVQLQKPAGDDTNEEKFYRQSRLHVSLYIVEISKYSEGGKLEEPLLDVLFPMLTSQCSLVKYIPKTSTHTSCSHGRSLGNFSSFCVIPMQPSPRTVASTKIDPGVYILIADICTMPYSVTVLALLYSGVTVRQRFTQDKRDTYIPEGSTCGLALKMEEHYGMHLRATLLYGCGKENSTLLDSVFQTQSGMVCPLSPCRTISSNPLKKFCTVPWISGQNKITNAQIMVKLEICEPFQSIWWDYQLPKEDKKEFPFEEREILKTGKRYPFHIGLPINMHDKVPKDNGYLYLDWGDVSLFIRGTDMVFITVFRHYPYPNNSIPLFRSQFWLKDEATRRMREKCPKIDHSLKTGLPIAGVGMFVLVVVIIFLYWRHLRRRQRGETGGLPPYIIHLGEVDEFDEQELQPSQ